jgi:signal transduction histidine kinase
MLPRISIRTKLILITVGTIVVANLIMAFFVRGLVYQNIVNNKMTMVDVLTASLVHDIKYDAETRQKEDVQAVIAKYITYYRIIRNISYYNTDRLDIADSEPHSIGASSEDPDVIAAVSMAKPSLHVTRPDWKNLGIRSVAPVLQGSKLVGAIALDVSIEDIQLTLSAIDRRIAMMVVAKAFLVSLVLFYFLRIIILTRLSQLTAATHQVAAKNYDIHVLDSGRDELGELAQAFDLMTRDLKSSKQEIERYNKHLEEMVQDATAQLQKAFEDLKNAQSQLVLNEKMASLGVLIAGVAHEINTPAGAILNVSRHLEKKTHSLPRMLEALKADLEVPAGRIAPCLEEVIESACKAREAVSYKDTKALESLLRAQGIPDPHQKASDLAKLNFTNPEKIIEYSECFVHPAFFAVVEAFGSIAQAAKISETSSQKIAEIVRALKYYAYSDKDKVEVIQINESITTALILLRNQLKDTVTVATDFDPELPRVPCTSEIHQVWTNLLTNAYDAIEAIGEGYHGEIAISTSRRGGQIVITITDNGVGIPEDKLGKVFDPFFTTKDIGKGTGLGLCIVSGIVKKLRGEVHVHSRPGRTVFEVGLPIGTSERPSDGERDQHDEHMGAVDESALVLAPRGPAVKETGDGG